MMSESEIIQTLRAKVVNNLHVAMPGVIESYEFKEQRASIKIAIKQLYNSGAYIDYPILSGVPVIFPRSGGASITMPVTRGDTCLVMFLDKDLRAWLLGGDNLKPRSTRAHHLNDAVAVMGLSPFTKVSKAENNTDVLLTYDGSQVRLKPQGVIDVHSAKEINIKTESVIINCKTATVKAEDSVSIECKTASIKSSEDSNIECKNASLKAAESITAECKNASLKSTGDITAECVNANIKATGAINSETPMFTQKGDMKIDGKIEVTGTSLLTGKLTTKAGIENSGVNLVSNGKTFETHTHSYQDVSQVLTAEGPAVEIIKIPTATQQPT